MRKPHYYNVVSVVYLPPHFVGGYEDKNDNFLLFFCLCGLSCLLIKDVVSVVEPLFLLSENYADANSSNS